MERLTIMGQPIKETIEQFIKQTEGNRPRVNDTRRDVKIKAELTDEEVKAQAEATEKWATQYLKEEKK
jgi:hypothetical protein